MSPSPRRLIDIRKKQSSLEIPAAHISTVQIPLAQDEPLTITEVKTEIGTACNDGANKYENISDNGSEISDEGYRSLGLIQSNNAKRISLHSQVSNEDADTNGKFVNSKALLAALLKIFSSPQGVSIETHLR